jgi:hypothetical protein
MAISRGGTQPGVIASVVRKAMFAMGSKPCPVVVIAAGGTDCWAGVGCPGIVARFGRPTIGCTCGHGWWIPVGCTGKVAVFRRTAVSYGVRGQGVAITCDSPPYFGCWAIMSWRCCCILLVIPSISCGEGCFEAREPIGRSFHPDRPHICGAASLVASHGERRAPRIPGQ